MSKKHNKPQQDVPQPAPAEPVIPGVPAAPSAAPVSKAMIWTFWGGVAAALVTARVLDAALPQVPERVIERWVMIAFAAFLAVFLYKLK
ncbi:MAG: hypothetical protein NDI60_10195 [Elusimicrobiales bacterium]|nr:hypothetical protein [Elusimicrobiales bacterium]